MFSWQLAVDPPVQRSGIGHKLMGRVLADAEAAELPVYLETAEPANVPYYRSFGFIETGREMLPRGAPLWLMLLAEDPLGRQPTLGVVARTAASSRNSPAGSARRYDESPVLLFDGAA